MPFVAVAYGGTVAATSPDGVTWTARTLPSSASWSSVTYGADPGPPPFANRALRVWRIH